MNIKHQTQAAIQKLIEENNILVFMKGEKSMPACGFSKIVIEILNNYNINYNSINVLKNAQIRQGIKEYSNWPTIPQVYINGEFIGGADILTNLYKTSELDEILEIAINS